MGYVFDVLWGGVVSAVHDGMSAGGEGEEDGCAWGGSEADVLGNV